MLLKSSNFNEFQNAMLAWRNTPTSGEAFSPAEKFFKRRQHSELFPSLPSLPAPVPPPQIDLQTAGKLLKIGDNVLLQNPLTKLWDDKGKIKEINPSTLSYIIVKDVGSLASRGRRLVKLDKSQPPDSNSIVSKPPDQSSTLPDLSADLEGASDSVAAKADPPPQPRRSRRTRRAPKRFQPS